MRIIVCFTLLLFHTYSLFAQDIEVKKFELIENDQTAALSPRMDINGNDCALVLVHTLKQSMEFEGWVVGDVDYKDDVYWVFMANGSKHLKIKHPDYQTKTVLFSEYGIGILKGGQMYNLYIVDETKDVISKIYSLGWNLGEMEVPNNARTFLRMAANRGDIKAQIAMAQLSLEGEVKVVDGEVNHKGMHWIKKLLAAGDSTCLEQMPGELMYAYAFQLIDDGYHSGDISLDRSLGRVDMTREKRVYTKVCEFEIKACIKGFMQAGNDLFVHYLKSNGLPQYSKQIITCCEDSSRVGNINSIKCLGAIYENGIGEKIDLLKAEKWYSRLCELTSSGTDDLCRIYGNKSFPTNKEKISFIKDQADKGNIEALFQLGYMYEEGRNVPLSEERALELYNKCDSHNEALYRATILLCKGGRYDEAKEKARILLAWGGEYCNSNNNIYCLRGIFMYYEVKNGIPFFQGRRHDGIKLLSSLAKQGHKDAIEFLKQIDN